MKLIKNEQNGVLVITIDGRIDGENPSVFKMRVHKWLKYNSNLIIDCSQLSYIDSSGLGALLSCLRQAVKNGGDLRHIQNYFGSGERFAAIPTSVSMVFELTRTDKVFSIFGSVSKALASFD